MMFPSLLSRLAWLLYSAAFAVSVCSSLVGHVYPAYASFSALQRRDSVLLNRWMTYWIVLGFFHVFEYIGDSFFFWFPFYDELKIIVLAYLVFPRAQGANFIYGLYLRPHLLLHQETIDRSLNSWRVRAEAVFGQLGRNLLSYLDHLSRPSGRSEAETVVDFEDISPSPRIVEVFDTAAAFSSSKRAS